jgi:hypothetical protein
MRCGSIGGADAYNNWPGRPVTIRGRDARLITPADRIGWTDARIGAGVSYMSGHVYKKIQLVGSSSGGIEDAIEGAVSRAAETLSNLDWFEVKEVRGNIQDGKIRWYQVTVDVGFRVLSPEDLHRDA